MTYTTSILAAACTLASVAAGATETEERNLNGWGEWGPPFFTLPAFEHSSASSKSGKSSGSSGKSGKSGWGSSSKSGKGSGKSSKGSSKSSKGLSKSSKGYSSSSEHHHFVWVWVPDNKWSDSWGDASSSGKSGKGSSGSGKSGKGSYGSGKSGKGSGSDDSTWAAGDDGWTGSSNANWYGDDDSSGSGKSGKGSYSSEGGSGKSGKGSYGSGGSDDDWSAGWGGGDSSGKSGKGSYSDDGNDDTPEWLGDDDSWGAGDEYDHTGFYKPNSSGSDGWASDGHFPGSYVDNIEQHPDNYDAFHDGNGYSLEDYNHVTDLCYASCDGDKCTYHVKVDLYASEFGAITFEECEDIGVFPTITMELGKTYEFVQSDISNYMHPIGFGYHPDSPYQGLPEIEGVNAPPGTDGSCSKDESCPAVEYMVDGKSITTEEYETMMAHPLGEYVSYGTFSAELNFPDDTGYSYDLFYWCHIHGMMGGRIKLLSGGEPINEINFPYHKIYFAPPSDYDVDCGTYGLENYQLPNHECPHRFVCNVDEVQDSTISSFASCLESMNCHMFAGMTTHATQGDVALFIHEMIPHHQNAVNMAKSLLSKWSEKCEDLSGADESDDCVMETILREIINAQNAQIQIMRQVLSDEGWDEFDDCPVKMNSSFEDFMQHGDAGTNYEHSYSNDGGTGGEGMTWSDNGYKNDGDDGHRALARGSSDGICKIPCDGDGDVCDINVHVDLFETVLGAFKFDECGDDPYPTIGLEIGKTYRFVQKEINNYYHPLGFAYFADGAHADKEELSEDDYLNYKINDEHVGLDGYEPKFFHSPSEWYEYGTFNVELTVPEDHGEDIFYFCHIHEFMSGRIKLMKDGELVSYEDVPEIPYEQEYQSSSFDKSCGTMHLGDFQLPHPECPHKFICDGASDSHFAQCLEAMDCAMMVGMTTYVEDKNDGDVALFNHQMIPHHENAVNMAKALLHEGTLQCSDITADTTDCKMTRIMYEIVNNQNYQIQSMRAVLENDGYPEFNDCKVNINSSKNHYSFLRA